MGNMIVCCVEDKHNQLDNGIMKDDDLISDNDSQARGFLKGDRAHVLFKRNNNFG